MAFVGAEKFSEFYITLHYKYVAGVESDPVKQSRPHPHPHNKSEVKAGHPLSIPHVLSPPSPSRMFSHIHEDYVTFESLQKVFAIKENKPLIFTVLVL